MAFPLPSWKKLLSVMSPRHRYFVLRLMREYRNEFTTAPGGLSKHQYWRGGYADHVHEVMSLGFVLYKQLAKYRSLPFTLSQALYVLFFHDLEKIFRFSVDKNGKPLETTLAKDSRYQNALAIMVRMKIPVTTEEANALRYTHGENQDYHPSRRIMNELAAFVHCCDTLSARLWYDFPGKRSAALPLTVDRKRRKQ